MGISMKELLLKHGFTPLGLNVYLKGNYTAVIWSDETKVYIGKRSPKHLIIIHSKVYESEEELKIELEKNHPV